MRPTENGGSCWVHIRGEAALGRVPMRLRGGSSNRSTLPPFPRRFEPVRDNVCGRGSVRNNLEQRSVTLVPEYRNKSTIEGTIADHR